MAIEAINEQLLRAVGVGVALFDGEGQTLSFRNDVFESWFEEAEPGISLPALFPTLDVEAVRAALAEGRRYATETTFRKKRRTIVIAQTFSRAIIGDEPVLVLECQNISRIRELESMIESYSNMVERNTREIQREKEQVEKLLLNIMPRAAYEEYKSFGVVAPQKYEAVTVMVLDFIDFAAASQRLAPASFVGELNELYSAFDRIGEQFACERIKTTGDTYLCIAGMHDPGMDHAAAVANAAIRFIRYLERRNANAETAWRCRIGIATGPVVGSVVGVQKYVYDVFGPAVNEAAAARDRAAAMEALVTGAAAALLAEGPALTAPSGAGAAAAGLRALSAV
ncbi:hypothetical protein LNKW23_11890 [Paralimibaculum aggregatum]|uniref:Guanylate cyclase domain-containing protein n=1 Tax=Paralimibaculum aggregatum TaxID=3036245 RepID=A0ABQ6LF68_9RHOB|nr:adenylate/guanylate cyclase domain-containing protein [Limibaculum sp. NKW23]GMG81976.1 hypothetical protein LNKW23_11890 [Limibaculum sp. NKW23]